MTWADYLPGQRLFIAGEEQSPRRNAWNLIGASATFNTSTQMWDISVSGVGAGSGDVIGPASSVDDRVVLFSGASGKLLKQSSFLIGDLIKRNGSVSFTGDQAMGGFKLTGLGAPSAGGDAANKTYVDAAVAGAGGGSGGGDSFKFTFSTTTTDSDPGAGTLRFNSATPASVTALYVDDVDSAATDIQVWLASLDDAPGAVKGRIIVQSISDPTKKLVYNLTGWTTATGYKKLTVAHVFGTSLPTTSAADTVMAFDSGPTVAGGTSITVSAAGAIARAALTGDVTASADSNATTIAADAVTYAKIQNVSAASRVIGRGSAAGAGDVQELTVGGGIEFSGTAIQCSAISGDITIAAGSTTAAITAGVIVNADINSAAAIALSKLQTVATSVLLGRVSVGTGGIETLDVTGGLEFNGSGIQRSALTGDITASAGSNTTAIAAGVIVDADINASAAIAHTKLATIATDRLMGRDTAGTGTLEAIALGASLEFSGSGTIQRAALTGDITAAANSNTTAIAAGVIVDADVNAAAAIAGSKISPNFVAQNITTTGDILLGTTPATVGDVRVNHGFTLNGRDNANANDRSGVRWGAVSTDTWTFGDAAVSASLVGSAIQIGDSTEMIEVASLATNREVISLLLGASLTTGHMPANTGDKVIFVADATTKPTTGFPLGGGILYADLIHGLSWKGARGVETTIAPHGDVGNVTKRRMIGFKTDPKRTTLSSTTDTTVASFDVSILNSQAVTTGSFKIVAHFIATGNSYGSCGERMALLEVTAGTPTVHTVQDSQTGTNSNGSPYTAIAINTSGTIVRLRMTASTVALNVEVFAFFEIMEFEP